MFQSIVLVLLVGAVFALVAGTEPSKDICGPNSSCPYNLHCCSTKSCCPRDLECCGNNVFCCSPSTKNKLNSKHSSRIIHENLVGEKCRTSSCGKGLHCCISDPKFCCPEGKACRAQPWGMACIKDGLATRAIESTSHEPDLN